MAELVADDGSRCVGDFFVVDWAEIIIVNDIFKSLAFVVCTSSAPHSVMAIKITK